ncbi:MAG: hypothetical protein JEZ00_09450 [Anaerolineaceae bacterium]|nr:hypothetical protein [Anaerolineaceae bacterium]
MENMASGSASKSGKILPIIGGIIIVALVIAIIWLSRGRQEQSVSYEATLSAITALAEQESVAQVSNTKQPTATQTGIPSTNTPTFFPATATEESIKMELIDLNVPCMRTTYDSPIKSYEDFVVSSVSYKESLIDTGVVDVKIPVLACMVQVEFSQPIDDLVKVGIYQHNDPTAWYEKELVPIDGEPNTYYAILDHHYIIDPPYWNLEYGLKIESQSQTYWDGALSLNRTFSGLCWEGSVPDPITLKCPDSDALEREPHPDMPTLVPGGIHN